MEELNNKKLLVVSGAAGDMAIVKAAHEMGLYVVCCDAHTNWVKSPAKFEADEAWNMDYSRTQEVADKCREAGIDGVIAGYSESKVMAACRIAEAIGTPFYATEEQIDITRNKRVFKELCEKNGVPVPREYCTRLPMSAEEREQIQYPVIVKPSDNGGRKGISVVLKEEDLDKALGYAQENSLNGEIVVEEYVRGLELSAVYTIADGNASLSCLNDKFISEAENGISTLCDFVITPSRYYDEYVRTVDGGIKALLKDIGAENGVATFQLIAGEYGIRAFEMGYRLNGNDDFKIVRENNDGIDFMKMLIHHSLTGSMGDDISKDNPCFKKYFCTFCLYLHGGTVSKVDCGKVPQLPNVMDITLLKNTGSVILDVGNNLQKAMMIKYWAETMEEVESTLRAIQENVVFLDQDGKNMLMKPFDPARLR